MIHDLKYFKKSLTEAIMECKNGDSIFLDDIVYNEKICIDKHNITMIGRKNTVITYDAANPVIIPQSQGGDGVKTYGTTGSATVLVTTNGDGFKAYNITFKNTYQRAEGQNGQAVAFKSEANNVYIENCKFISSQDTLYVDYGKYNVIRDSYIEGDVDFIFGSADCIFYNCQIHAKKVFHQAYFLAPSTYEENLHGFIFYKCNFESDEGLKTYLGRAWFPSKSLKNVYPRCTLIDCNLKGDIEFDLIQMHSGDSREYSLKLNNIVYNGTNLNYNDDVELQMELIERYIKY